MSILSLIQKALMNDFIQKKYQSDNLAKKLRTNNQKCIDCLKPRSLLKFFIFILKKHKIKLLCLFHRSGILSEPRSYYRIKVP